MGNERYRSLLIYGTGEAGPSESLRERFKAFAVALSTPIPIAVQNAFTAREHDLSRGSDHLFLVDGMITQTAAEVWAARQLLLGELAPLTILHHARALYEAHAVAYWMFGDFASRWPRVLKDSLRERQRFEDAARASIGEVRSDITDRGKSLVQDASIPLCPTLWDMTRGSPILEYDHAIFWKYASSFIHPAETYSAATDLESERTLIEQILAGVLRHSAGVYRLIINQFALVIGSPDEVLREAEEYARYPFDVAVALRESGTS